MSFQELCVPNMEIMMEAGACSEPGQSGFERTVLK